MHILFLEKRIRIEKLGMFYISRVLKNAGHSVALIQDDIDPVETYLDNHNVDFIFYSVITGEEEWYLKKNSELKKTYEFTSVFGGPHFTFFPECASENPDIDHIVIGPAENIILDIVENRTKTSVTKGIIPDINKLPHPDRSILYDRYPDFANSKMKRFIGRRDCIHNCKYCFNHAYHKIFKDQRSMFYQIIKPERYIEEILDVKNKYPLQLIYFNDDNFVENHEWVHAFLELYREKIKIPFIIQGRAENFNEEIMQDLSNTGVDSIHMALESANNDTLKFLGRGKTTNKDIEEAVNLCKKYNIKTRILNMIGLPVQDMIGDAFETLKFNIKIHPTDSWVSIFQPMPKTELWDYCKRVSLINPQDIGQTFNDNTILNFKYEHKEKINRLQKWWAFIVRYQLPDELIDCLLDIKLSENNIKTLLNIRYDQSKKILYNGVI